MCHGELNLKIGKVAYCSNSELGPDWTEIGSLVTQLINDHFWSE